MRNKIVSILLGIVLAFGQVTVAYGANETDGTEFYTLTIQYYADSSSAQGGKVKIASDYKASMLPGSSYSVESPTIKGYKVKDDGLQTVSGTLDKDTTIEVGYTDAEDQVGYKINYIGRSVVGDNETTLAEEKGTAPIGTIVTAEDKDFTDEGYVRDAGTLNLSVTADGNAELNVYYTEMVNPFIVFFTEGSYVKPITAKAGEPIPVDEINRIKETTPIRAGYTFERWDQDIPATMPEDNLVINAKWKPSETTYTVEYWFQDTEGDGYTRNEGLDETRTGTSGTTVSAVTGEEKLGKEGDGKYEGKYNDKTIADESLIAADDWEAQSNYKATPFYGFDYDHCEDVTVAGDGSSVLRLYYNRETWTVKIHSTPVYLRYDDDDQGTKRDDLHNTDDVIITLTGRYGSEWDSSKYDFDITNTIDVVEYFNETHNYAKDDTSQAKYYKGDKDQPKDEFVYLLWENECRFGESTTMLSRAFNYIYYTYTEEDTFGTGELNLHLQYAVDVRYLIRWVYGETLESAKAGALAANAADPDYIKHWSAPGVTHAHTPPASADYRYDLALGSGCMWTWEGLAGENGKNIEYLDQMVLGRQDMTDGAETVKTIRLPIQLPAGFNTKTTFDPETTGVFLAQAFPHAFIGESLTSDSSWDSGNNYRSIGINYLTETDEGGNLLWEGPNGETYTPDNYNALDFYHKFLFNPNQNPTACDCGYDDSYSDWANKALMYSAFFSSGGNKTLWDDPNDDGAISMSELPEQYWDPDPSDPDVADPQNLIDAYIQLRNKTLKGDSNTTEINAQIEELKQEWDNAVSGWQTEFEEKYSSENKKWTDFWNDKDTDGGLTGDVLGDLDKWYPDANNAYNKEFRDALLEILDPFYGYDVGEGYPSDSLCGKLISEVNGGTIKLSDLSTEDQEQYQKMLDSENGYYFDVLFYEKNGYTGFSEEFGEKYSAYADLTHDGIMNKWNEARYEVTSDNPDKYGSPYPTDLAKEIQEKRAGIAAEIAELEASKTGSIDYFDYGIWGLANGVGEFGQSMVDSPFAIYLLKRQDYDLYFVDYSKPLKDGENASDIKSYVVHSDQGIFYEDSVSGNVADDYDYVNPTDPTGKNRTFEGWYTNADFIGDPVDFDSLKMPSNDLYLYAKWSDPSYTVEYYSDGEQLDELTQSGIEEGKRANEPKDPTKIGCEFVGWYYEEFLVDENGQPVDENGNVVTDPEQQASIIRPWIFEQGLNYELQNSYTVKLHAVWKQTSEASCTIKHVYKDEAGNEQEFYTTQASGKTGDTVIAGVLNWSDEAYIDGLTDLGLNPNDVYLLPDATTKSKVLENGENEITFYYSSSPNKSYVVKYVDETTQEEIADRVTVNETDLSFVTEKAKDIEGYELVEDQEGLIASSEDQPKLYKVTELVVGENNEIVFYYSKKEVIAIAPAPVTIYMGGQGYDGTVNDKGEIQGNNGFPVPGFVINAPDDAKDFDPTKATLHYKDEENDIDRSWDIVSYDGLTGHNIYRFVSLDGETAPVRMQFVTEDGSVVAEDEFTISDHLDQDLTMEVYGEGVDAGKVTMEYNGKSYSIATGTALLKVRSTTSEVEYGGVVESETSIEKGSSGVVASGETVYYINNSAVRVTEGEVALLFDDIVENNDVDGTSNTDLLKARTDQVLGSASGTRYYQCKYLDLVDTNNGNVWVAADRDITVYWPLPEGTDGDTSFKLLHFEGLHREMGVDEVEGKIDSCTVDSSIAIENTGTHIKFDIEKIQTDEDGNVVNGGFSPFVLVWETDDGEEDPVTPPPSEGDDEGVSDDSDPGVSPGTPGKSDNPSKTELPSTGDAISVLVAALAVLAVVAAGVVFAIRKRQNK